MPSALTPSLVENVVFRKVEDDHGREASLELFKDRFNLKLFSPRSVLDVFLRVPPTFPPSQTVETIHFAEIMSIGEVPGTDLSRRSQTEVRTNIGMVWEIRGRRKILLALWKSYQDWKNGDQNTSSD